MWVPKDADLKWWLEVWVAGMTLLGIPVGLLSYRYQKRKDREIQEYGAYDALDARYIDYLNICLRHPSLDVFDLKLHGSRSEGDKKRQEEIIFAVLIAIIERAFLMYQGKSKKVRDKQWSGWDKYAAEWAKRENFREAWQKQSGDFDKGFEDYMNGKIEPALT